MRNRRGTEAARIRAQYGVVLVDATTGVIRAAEEHDVASIDALVKLAEQCGADVHCVPDRWTSADLFFVDDGGVRYRYRAEGRTPRRRLVTV